MNIHQSLCKYCCETKLSPKTESQVWLQFTACHRWVNFLFLSLLWFQPKAHPHWSSVCKDCSVCNNSSTPQIYRQNRQFHNIPEDILKHQYFLLLVSSSMTEDGKLEAHIFASQLGLARILLQKQFSLLLPQQFQFILLLFSFNFFP